MESKVNYDVILQATLGDIEAINTIIDHYQYYINRLAIRKIYDENGTSHFIIDEEFKRHLETKLIMGILKFKL